MPPAQITMGTFEPVLIYEPSIVVCTWLMLQLLVFGFAADGNHDVAKHNKTFFEQWYGFFVLLPTLLFDIGLFFYATLEQTASVKLIKRAAQSVALNVTGSGRPARSQYDQLDIAGDLGMPGVSSNQAATDAIIADEINEATISAALEADGGADRIDGYQMTASDLARESALNRVLVNKWIWTFPTTFLAACKMSFDTRRAYSWHVVFLPLYIYLAVLLVIAINRGNFFMRDQRDIDRWEREKRRQFDAQRRDVKTILKEHEEQEGEYNNNNNNKSSSINL